MEPLGSAWDPTLLSTTVVEGGDRPEGPLLEQDDLVRCTLMRRPAVIQVAVGVFNIQTCFILLL